MKDVVVIKVGTGVLTNDEGSLDGSSLVKLVTALADLVQNGVSCVLVSSGAVGAGVPVLGLSQYPDDVETRQAAAAVGQARLMHSYQTVLGQFEIAPAQLLLTRGDLDSETRRARVLATFSRLLQEKNILPVVNENDSVSVDELRIGDNDLLSVQVAELLGAKRLILLSTVDGLLDGKGELIEQVESVKEVTDLVRNESGKFSIGGMASKLEAVSLAVEHGIEVTIANGRCPEKLPQIIDGERVGTRFLIASAAG